MSEIKLYQIERVLPRLKYSVLPSAVNRWLNNFEDADKKLALELLYFFEYIDYNELLYILDKQLFNCLNALPPNEEILIFPFGNLGKSSIHMLYPLNKTKTFIKNKNNITFSSVIKDILKYKHVIYIDDFIGSGNSFDKFYNLDKHKEIIDDKNLVTENLISCIIMDEGMKFLKEKYPYLRIYAELRYKLISSGRFNQLFDDINASEKLIDKYGKKFTIFDKSKKKNIPIPKGYSNSESLIAFYYSTPNNTFPIFLDDRFNWVPLFSRFATHKLSEAKKLKDDFRYFISINYNLNKKFSHLRKFNSRHAQKKYELSLILFLFLKVNNFEDLSICQILSITMDQLEHIYFNAEKENFIHNKNLTKEAFKLLDELNSTKKKSTTRNEKFTEIESNKPLYLPKQFSGSS